MVRIRAWSISTLYKCSLRSERNRGSTAKKVAVKASAFSSTVVFTGTWFRRRWMRGFSAFLKYHSRTKDLLLLVASWETFFMSASYRAALFSVGLSMEHDSGGAGGSNERTSNMCFSQMSWNLEQVSESALSSGNAQ